MGKGVKQTDNAAVFQNVEKVECQDRKRYLECEVQHSDGSEGMEGSFRAADMIAHDAKVETVSTNADTLKLDFDGGTGSCKLYKENDILSCSRE